MEDRIGSISEGKLADVVIMNNNPLMNLNAYGEPAAVIKEGILVYCRKKMGTTELAPGKYIIV